MKNKRLAALALTVVMLIGGAVSVFAYGSDSDSDTVLGCDVEYEVICTDTSGESSTRIYAETGMYTRVDAGVTLYVRNRSTGAISEYGSDTDSVDDYAVAYVGINSGSEGTYIGYFASSAHYVTAESGSSSDSGSAYLEAYN